MAATEKPTGREPHGGGAGSRRWERHRRGCLRHDRATDWRRRRGPRSGRCRSRSSAFGLRRGAPAGIVRLAGGVGGLVLLIHLAEPAALLVVLPRAASLHVVVEFVVGGQQVAI